jgi:hypothetical protein
MRSSLKVRPVQAIPAGVLVARAQARKTAPFIALFVLSMFGAILAFDIGEARVERASQQEAETLSTKVESRAAALDAASGY